MYDWSAGTQSGGGTTFANGGLTVSGGVRDWVEITGRGGMVVYGRSDATRRSSYDRHFALEPCHAGQGMILVGIRLGNSGMKVMPLAVRPRFTNSFACSIEAL